jgi:hypothetical protein
MIRKKYTPNIKSSVNRLLEQDNPKPLTASPVPPVPTINTFNLEYDAATFTIICFGSVPASDYYTYDSTISVGTILYTDSVEPLSSFAPAGYYGNNTNYYRITGATGEIISSNSCT